jgi:hypothetical protein
MRKKKRRRLFGEFSVHVHEFDVFFEERRGCRWRKVIWEVGRIQSREERGKGGEGGG